MARSSEDDDFLKLRSQSKRVPTPEEILIEGLETNKPKQLDIIEDSSMGRSVIAGEDIESGDFVVEYKYKDAISKSQKKKREKEYAENGEGCYTLEAQLPGGKWICLDATRNYHSWGRYINHSRDPNLKVWNPKHVRGKYRVGFTAKRDIKKGEHLSYDYGRQRNQPDWMKTRSKLKRSAPQEDGMDSGCNETTSNTLQQVKTTEEEHSSTVPLSPLVTVVTSSFLHETTNDVPGLEVEVVANDTLPSEDSVEQTAALSGQDKVQGLEGKATSQDSVEQTADPAGKVQGLEGKAISQDSVEQTAEQGKVQGLEGKAISQDSVEQTADPAGKVQGLEGKAISQDSVEQTADPAGKVQGLEGKATSQDSVEQTAASSGQESTACGQCSQGTAVQFCVDCSTTICDKCLTLHKRLAIFKDHLIKPMDYYHNIIKTPRTPTPPTPERVCGGCQSGATASQHCRTCNTDICEDCIKYHKTLTFFSRHELQDLNKCVKEEGQTCGACAVGGKAVSCCQSCDTLLCESCTQAHKQLKIFSSHKVVSATVQQTRCGGCTNKEIAVAYCSDCQHNICTTCFKMHKELLILKGHDVSPSVQRERETESESESESDEPAGIEGPKPKYRKNRELTVLWTSSSEDSPVDLERPRSRKRHRLSSDLLDSEDKEPGSRSRKRGRPDPEVYIVGTPDKDYHRHRDESSSGKRGRPRDDPEPEVYIAGTPAHKAYHKYRHESPSYSSSPEEAMDNPLNSPAYESPEEAMDNPLNSSAYESPEEAMDNPLNSSAYESPEEAMDNPLNSHAYERAGDDDADQVEDDQVEDDQVEDDQVEDDQVEDDQVEDDQVEDDADADEVDKKEDRKATTKSHARKRLEAKKRRARNREKSRKYRQCPISGCNAKPQKKLSNHLTRYHPDLASAARSQALRAAKCVSKHYIKQEHAQSTLKFEHHQESPQESTPKPKAATRSLGRFDLSHPELVAFKQNLMSLAGKKRSESTADAIVIDISKILYFHNENELQWENIADRNKLLRYIQKVDEMNVGPEGQLTKLERVNDVFHFLKRTKKDNADLRSLIAECEGEIHQWKRTLRAQKQALQVRRLEEASEMDLTMDTITAVVDNPDMWDTFSKIVARAKNGKSISEHDLKLAMGSVMLAVKLKSYQRPSAICNCTVSEYQNAKTRFDDTIEMEVTVIAVKSHKTGRTGAANLTMDASLKQRLDLYFQYIRPLLVDPSMGDIPYLFILPGSQMIVKYGNLETFLRKNLKIDVPTSTKARKIGSTCSATSLDYQTHSLVTKQMSHRPEVSKKYYEAVHGTKHAAFAFGKMESLRMGKTAHGLEDAGSASTNKRWSHSDTVFVKKHFAKDIKRKRTPMLATCSDLGLDRTAKQIQDKVRTLIRQAKNEELDT